MGFYSYCRTKFSLAAIISSDLEVFVFHVFVGDVGVPVRQVCGCEEICHWFYGGGLVCIHH